MPRNGSGSMTIVNSFSPGTTISSSQVNANNTDIADELTNSLALDGQSTMSGQLKAADGTDTAPGITFGGDLDTGFYRSGTNTFKAVVSSGTVVATFGTSGLDAPTLKQNGTAVAVLGANTFTADQTIQRNAALSSLVLDRSDTHGDNVLVGSLEFRGRDSGGANQAYGFIDSRCVLDDAGSETGALEFRTGNAGSATQRLYIRTGIYTPNATGGDPGADKINAAGYQINGTAFGFPSTAIFENQQTSGTAGPTYTASGWRTVTYNTEVTDPDGIAAVSSNRFTFTSTGTYRVRWRAALQKGSSDTTVATRFQNVTASTTAARGLNVSGPGSGVGAPTAGVEGEGLFTVSNTSHEYEVQVYPTANTIATGAAGTGAVEVYAQITFEKIK
jgi:hypothetical protein